MVLGGAESWTNFEREIHSFIYIYPINVAMRK